MNNFLSADSLFPYLAGAVAGNLFLHLRATISTIPLMNSVNFQWGLIARALRAALFDSSNGRETGIHFVGRRCDAFLPATAGWQWNATVSTQPPCHYRCPTAQVVCISYNSAEAVEATRLRRPSRHLQEENFPSPAAAIAIRCEKYAWHIFQPLLYTTSTLPRYTYVAVSLNDPFSIRRAKIGTISYTILLQIFLVHKTLVSPGSRYLVFFKQVNSHIFCMRKSLNLHPVSLEYLTLTLRKYLLNFP